MHGSVETHSEEVAGEEVVIRFKSILMGIGATVAGLILTILGVQRRRNRKLKEELDEQKAISQIRQTQMETVVQLQNELKTIRSEDAPDHVSPPDNGDVDDHLMRLNSLHTK